MQPNFRSGPAVQLNVPFLGLEDARKHIGRGFGFEVVNPDQVSSSADNYPDPLLIDYQRTNSFADPLDEGTIEGSDRMAERSRQPFIYYEPRYFP